jgi:hypothetical protein
MKHFVLHYLEMVIAMFAGMVVLGVPADLIVEDPAPAVELLAMAAMMTAPMVAWMRFRGHAWRPCIEMSAAMFVPALIAVALLPFADYMTLMGLEHVAMLVAMALAMLARPAEYAGHVHA